MRLIKTEFDTQGKLTALDGKPVLHTFTVTQKEFPKVSKRLAINDRLPFAFAVCDSNCSASGVSIYVQYYGEWHESNNYSDLLVKHLLNLLKAK